MIMRANQMVPNQSLHKQLQQQQQSPAHVSSLRLLSHDEEASSESIESKLALLKSLSNRRSLQRASAAAVAAGTQIPESSRNKSPDSDIMPTITRDRKASSSNRKTNNNLDILNDEEEEDEFERTSTTQSSSFGSIAMKAVTERRKVNVVSFKKMVILFLLHRKKNYEKLGRVCAIVESGVKATSNGFFIFFIACCLYIGLIIPIWISLLMFLYKGRLYTKFRNEIYRCCFSLIHHKEHSPSIQTHSTIGRALTADERGHLRFIADNIEHDAEVKRPSRGEPGLKKYMACNLSENDTMRTPIDKTTKLLSFQHSSSETKKMTTSSEADFLFFYWSSQKQRMRRGQLQADSARVIPTTDTDFSIPTAMTTGQIRAPVLANRRCLQCGIPLNIYISGLLCNNCCDNKNNDDDNHHRGPIPSTQQSHEGLNVLPHESCPNFGDIIPHEPVLASRTIYPFSADRGVDPEAELNRLKPDGRSRSLLRQRFSLKKIWHDMKRCFLDNSQQHSNWNLYQFCINVHDFAAFQIALILRNLGWCVVYLWSTTLIHRPTPYDTWDLSGMTLSYHLLEDSFMWMITWDYIIGLYASQDPVRHIFNFFSLLDLLTMPTAKFMVNLVSTKTAEQYIIYSGSLRVLRLVRIESILTQVIPWISQVKLRIISLAVGAIVITVMFASTMFVLEAPYIHREGFDTVYGYTFFAVVTISTVGYGDFAPTKNISKAIVMLAIVAALAFLPSQIQKLVSALQVGSAVTAILYGTPPRVMGRIPGEQTDFILIAGPIAPRQLTMICREVVMSLPGSCNNILIVSPDDITSYKNVIRSAFLKGRMRVAALQLDFSLQKYYRRARAVFIVGNINVGTDSAVTGYFEADPEAAQIEDDHNTLLRFLGAQTICWPDRPICVQLHDGTTKHLVTEMGAYHVLCLQHIKMKLMAKSCAGCPGFVTLMTNLFHQPLPEKSFNNDDFNTFGNIHIGVQNSHYYFRGAKYKMYRLEFPECFFGLQFSLLARFLLVQYEVYLLGVSCITKEYWLNPIGYCVGDELRHFTDWPFAAVVAAPSLEIVQNIASLRKIDLANEIIMTENASIKRKKRSRDYLLMEYQRQYIDSSPTYRIQINNNNNNALDPLINVDDNENITSPNGERGTGDLTDRIFRNVSEAEILSEINLTPVGIKEVQDVDIAMKFVFDNPKVPLIVVCGWPRGIPIFLATVLNNLKANIIILSHYYPAGLSNDGLKPFIGMCAWVRGSAIDVGDLLRAGVLQAQSCAVFSTPHVAWKQPVGSKRTDTQAILVREFIFALRHSDTLMEKRFQHLLRSQQRQRLFTESLDGIERKSTTEIAVNSVLRHRLSGNSATRSQIYTKRRPLVPEQSEFSNERSVDNNYPTPTPLVIIELKNDSNIQYLHVNPMPSDVSWSAKSDENDVWSQEGLYIANAEFTSGRVLLEELLHGMLAFALPVSRYCMDSRIIDHFVEGIHMPLPGNMPATCPFWLETFPRGFKATTFGALYNFLLRETSKLCIGVYRQTQRPSGNKTPLDLLQGIDAVQYVVISCPPLEMVLQPDDQFYVIHPCPVEALGLLLSPNTQIGGHM